MTLSDIKQAIYYQPHFPYLYNWDINILNLVGLLRIK